MGAFFLAERSSDGQRQNLFQKYKEIIMYLIFGVLTTVISWGLYYVFMHILPFNYDVTLNLFGRAITFTLNIFVSNVLSWIFAVAFAFVTNKLWVFNSKSWESKLVWKELWTFVGGRLFTGVIEWVGVPLLVGLGLNQTLFNTEGFPAKIIVTVIIVILNYILSKFISFTGSKDKKQEDKNTKTGE